MPLHFIIILSIVQGLTEFLPVSSSGHLALVPKFLHAADQGVLMDVALHIGTLFAVLIYYRDDVWRMIKSVLQWKTTQDKDHQRLAVYIVIATIPAVIGGLALHLIYPEGIRDVRVIATTTIVFGILLGLADRFSRSNKTLHHLRLREAFAIGCAQMLAMVPGTSRSGVTITTARLLGFERVDAARFSFLLGIPAISAAGLLGCVEIVKSGNTELLHAAAIAVVLSFLAGLAAIHFMMRWLAKYSLWPFAVYRVILGIAIILLLIVGN